VSQPPLPPQTRYWNRAEDRQRVVNALFDRSAGQYDRACGIMSLGLGQTYRRAALERGGLRQGMAVLDVGTGTGLVAREVIHLLGSSGRVTGIDPSLGMMAAGRHRSRAGVVQGVGECLPFSDCCFDFITMGYALRHVPDLDQTFGEYLRVLKPGGKALLLEITKPTSAIGTLVARLYFGIAVPCAAWMGTGSADAAKLMRFYWDTIAQCVPPESVLASLRRVGFVATGRTVLHGIFSEYTAMRAQSLHPKR
jgi:demethylmenaquinone methyltransferase/2-methoxy-6-polyprenyl-1,4-benzoquinol methylase